MFHCGAPPVVNFVNLFFLCLFNEPIVLRKLCLHTVICLLFWCFPVCEYMLQQDWKDIFKVTADRIISDSIKVHLEFIHPTNSGHTLQD